MLYHIKVKHPVAMSKDGSLRGRQPVGVPNDLDRYAANQCGRGPIERASLVTWALVRHGIENAVPKPIESMEHRNYKESNTCISHNFAFLFLFLHS